MFNPEEDIINSDGEEKLPNEDDKIWRNGNKQEEVELFNTSNIWCIHGNTVVWSNSTSCLRKSFYDQFKPKWYFYEFGDIFFCFGTSFGKRFSQGDICENRCGKSAAGAVLIDSW